VKVALHEIDTGGSSSQEDEKEGSSKTNQPVAFDAIYASRFLHCLGTEATVVTVLLQVSELLIPADIFLGVFGRNPLWVCGQRKDFERVMHSTGFRLELLVEEDAGATWFSARKNEDVS